MCRRPWIRLLLAACCSLGAGCQQDTANVRSQARAPTPQQQQQLEQQQQQLLAQQQDSRRRAEQLDINNQDLHAQLAQSQRQYRLLQDEVTLLRGRLGETTDLLAQSQTAQRSAETQHKALAASTRRRGGAVISANNSLRAELPVIQVPGVQVRGDGDVVRIEIPADSVFLPRTATMHQAAAPLLDRVAGAILRSYPQHRIGIEGHTDIDQTTAGGWRTNHQLSAAQAVAVFDYVTSRHTVNPKQLFVLGHGSNHPVASNGTASGTARNRRIELVIYPETTARR